MALFKCNSCQQVYEDYYPPDDSCLKCKSGTIRIMDSEQIVLSTNAVDNPLGDVELYQNCNVALGTLLVLHKK